MEVVAECDIVVLKNRRVRERECKRIVNKEETGSLD